MNRRNVKFSRRALLKRLGVGAALLPMLETEWRSAGACSGTSGPRRAFFFVWANGMLSNITSWPGPGTGAAFTLPAFMSSLEPYRNDLLLLDGLSYTFLTDSPNPSGGEITGHACFQGMLTGELYRSFGSSTANNVAGGISIDQHIGNGLRAKGYGGLVSLNTMVYSRSTARLSWKAAGTPVVPDDDPYHVYSQLMVGIKPGTATPNPMPTPNPIPGSGPVTMPVDKMLLMRKSVIDFVLADLGRFNKVIGTADKHLVEGHLDSVREIELTLGNQIRAQRGTTGAGGASGMTPVVMPPSGEACTLPVLAAGVAHRDTKNFHTVSKMQIDLAVAAMAADATRVVVLQLGDQGDPDIVLYNLGFKHANSGDSTGDANGYHEMAHANTQNKVTCDTWFQSQVAYAIGAMKGVTEAGGKTLLDSSIFVGMNNMRHGNHEFKNVPAILAGNCGGYFATGRSIKLPTGTVQNGVLIAVANALGVPTMTFGNSRYGGELAALKG